MNEIADSIKNARNVSPIDFDNYEVEEDQADLGVFDLEAMNREWALVLVGAKAVLVHEQPLAKGEEKLQLRTVDAFTRWYENKFVHHKAADGKVKTTTWAKFWLQSPHRRQYRGLEFHPNPDGDPCTPNFLNLWRGFDVKAEPQAGTYDILKDHIYTNICNGDQSLYDWVFGWFAHMFQCPRERTGTALVFRGKMGSGKSTLGEVMGSLISNHYFQVDDGRYITGNFNAHMAKCLLLQAEEAVWAGDKNAEGRLKGLITSKHQMVEHKGVDPIRLQNYVRLLMTSNEDWVVPAGKDERRFCVLDVGDAAAQNHGYFAQLYHELDNGGREKLLYDLLHFDLSKVDLWTIPRTEALLEQKLRSLDSVESWWFDRLLEGEVFTNSGEWSDLASINALHDDYLKQADAIGIKRRVEKPHFGRKMRQLVPTIDRTRPRSVKFEEDSRKRGRCYIIPPLQVCRDAFCEAVGQQVEWGNDD